MHSGSFDCGVANVANLAVSAWALCTHSRLVYHFQKGLPSWDVAKDLASRMVMNTYYPLESKCILGLQNNAKGHCIAGSFKMPSLL